MSTDFIAAQLKEFKKLSIESQRETEEFCHESPFLRTKREVQQELQRAEKYRASILKNVTTFAGLSTEAIITAAQSMEEVYYVKGDDIIEQDDIGDSFFVLEIGQVVVTRKANMRDYDEKPRELAKLGNNAHFGEIALLTAEPRSATVTVISDTAKCLRMTKAKFDELLSTTNKLQAENRRLIGRDVLDAVPLFRTLTAVNKKKLLDAMIPMTYLPSSYICRQGTTGNSFFILTEGHCKVTVNCEDKSEKEVGKLRAGDFFGEVALMEANNRRTANVISVDSVSCLTLSRADFNRLLTNLKVKLLEHQNVRGANNQAGAKGASSDLLQTSSLANKRRISSYDTHGHRDENRINNLFKRFTKFCTESVWNSLYSRLYRELLLDPSKQIEYGVVAETVMRENDQRYPAVQALSAQALRILEMDPPRRSIADHAFILGLLKQRNELKEKLCKTWPAHQFGVLCKRVKIQKFLPFKKVFEIDSTGTAAYLILRGAVRIFSKTSASDAHGPKAFFEQDVGPGEVFGEAALGGIHTRMHMAQALTHVDAIVIDDQDFMAAQDKDSTHMGTEERQRFLAAVPMFKDWDSYKLLRLAHALVQEEVNKGVVLTHHGKPSKDLFFVVNGRLDVVTSLEKRYVITPLLKHDYIGESGIVNKFIKSAANRLAEEFYCVAVTKVEVLILPDSAFTLFDLRSIDIIRSTFVTKMEWRRKRVRAMKFERAKMRKHLHHMDKECEALHEFPIDREFLSDQQIVLIETQERLLQAEATRRGGGGGGRTQAISTMRASSPLHDTTATAVVSTGLQTGLRATVPTAAGSAQDDDVFHEGIEDLVDPAVSPQHQLVSIPRPSSAAAEKASTARRDLSRSKARPQSAAATAMSTAPPLAAPSKLRDIEDIPTIFVRDMDLFMVSVSCRTERQRAKFASTVSRALRPKSARAREFAERSQDSTSVVAKRADVLAVLQNQETTKAKLVIKNRRNSAAMTAFALMHPTERARPHTAGDLRGTRPFEAETGAEESEVIPQAQSADSAESSRYQQGVRPDHISTNVILKESRHLAMQSGGVDFHKADPTPLGSPYRSGLPSIPGSPAVANHKAHRLGDDPHTLPRLQIPTNTATTANTITDTTSSAVGAETDATAGLLIEIEGGGPVRAERESHTPFGSPQQQRRESTCSTPGAPTGSPYQNRRRSQSLALRGSMCIPMSQSYANTLSQSSITPKSSMALKLEASLDKYIYKRDIEK